MKARTLSVRIPEDAYIELSQRKSKSLNEFIVQAVQEKLIREREAQYAAGFASLVGSDAEVESWQRAQREAMKHIDG